MYNQYEKKFMNIRELVKNIIEKLVKFYSVYILYSSVLAIILFPMLLISGIFVFFLSSFRTSWYLADPTIFNKDIRVVWLNTWLHYPNLTLEVFTFIKIAILIIGIIIFIISLFQLIFYNKKQRGLVQQGIYRYIRHPQNLSIIIMALPLFLYGYGGFRMGDFVSWVQFIFLMIIYSDFGDIKLKKKYPEEFQLYYEYSGFFLPRILPYRISHYFSAVYNKKFRYPLLLSIYILCIYILYQLFLFLPFFPLYI